MATTAATLITRAINTIQGRQRSSRVILDEAISTTTDATVMVSHNEDWIKPGDFLEINDELMICISREGKQVRVGRGQEESTAATHSAGDVILVEPPFPRYEVFRDLIDEIESWAESVVLLNTASLSFTSTSLRADLMTSNADRFASILRAYSTPDNAEDVTTDVPLKPLFTVTTNDVSKVEVQLRQPLQRSETVVVIYGTKIQAPTATSDDLEALMPATCIDALRYGVMARMTEGLEAQRAMMHAAKPSAKAAEHPPGQGANTSEYYRALAQARFDAEVKRQRRLYPYQSRS